MKDLDAAARAVARRGSVRIPWRIVLSSLAFFVALLPGAVAADDTIVLRDAAAAVFWHGGPLEGVAVPETCNASACHEVALKVALPKGQVKRSAAIQIAIRWTDESNDLDLYVYGPDEESASQSAAPVSTAESLLVPLANGTYRILITSTESHGVDYEGLAQVEPQMRSRPTRDLLPDLISRPSRRPQIATGAYISDPGAPSLPTGCYLEEMLEQGARRCLRFDQVVVNVGDGPFEVRFRLDDLAGARSLDQRIYLSDGTWRDRRADTYEFHPTHAHFHYQGFAQAHLWRSNAEGQKVGKEPLRSSRKNGFCMLDVELQQWGKRGDAPRRYTPPGGCFGPNDSDAAQRKVYSVNGISVGWADVYFWYVPDQFIEISGVPDGFYLLETISDPADTVVEIDERNNSAFAHIQICGASAQIVGDEGPC